MLRVAVHGGLGRMGRRLISCICSDPNLNLCGVLVHKEHSDLNKELVSIIPEVASSSAASSLRVTRSLSSLGGCADVVIDFSTVEGTLALLADVKDSGVRGIVIGTTGFSEKEIDQIGRHAENVPIMHAANYSIGVNLLCRLATETAKVLNRYSSLQTDPVDNLTTAMPRYDVEIVEQHHRRKKDAPSGTALALLDAVCKESCLERSNMKCGREGIGAERDQAEIGMHSIRMGDVIGDHTVYFTSDQETVSLTHHAKDRDLFALGALTAAKWIPSQNPGIYNMQHLLFP